MAKGWSFGALIKALKGAAFLDIGTVANSVAAGNDSRIVNALQKGNNLGDVADITTARNNLFAAYRNGNQDTQFNVGGATNGTHAVRLDQFQSGSDGNGTWVRLPGGGQYCRVNMKLPAYVTTPWTFPAQFPGRPAVFLATFNGENRIWINDISSTGCNMYSSLDYDIDVNVLAIW